MLTVKPPAGLETAGKRSFDRTVVTLTAFGERAEDFADAIERYCRAVDAASAIRRGWNARGCPVLASGAAGQPRPHPLLNELRESERHALAMSEALLLTPASRARAGRARGGRPMGTSPAADRQPGNRLRVAR